jgi:pimeloyl-ACP methyl ester carboxylesterase
MNARPGRWRRMAMRFAQHASRVLPGAGSPWHDAMRRELDYIGDDPAALRWAVGCILASYRERLVHRPWFWFGARAIWRYATTCGVLMLATGLALQGNARGQTKQLQPAFDEATCDLPDVSPEVRPRLRCGRVSVPRDYDKPGAGQFKLAVVVVRSAQQPTLPDPVVYINGGPGGPLTIYADHQARTPYAPRRDLILVDQRGAGRSEPSLCPNLNGELLDANIAIATDATEDALARRRAIYSACREEAIAHGLDLRNFGTRITVADFEWVRQALRVEHWNVYGESYGTTVAMTLVSLHPERVRSLVLDSVYPPDPLPLWSTIVADARDAFFASCARDNVCSTLFPDLAGIYRETLKRLDLKPLVVAVPTQMHRPDDRVELTASLFEVLVGNLIYYPTAYPILPRLIEAVHDGDSRRLAAVFASELAAARQRNVATSAAVECRDWPHYRVELPAAASVLDRMQLYGVCDGWSDLGPAPIVPVGAGVPTLVLAGQFDPVAGVSLSRHVAELIGANARWIEFPRAGHNVRAFSPCGAKITADFIDDPTQLPDTSCADRVAPIRFLPRDRPP